MLTWKLSARFAGLTVCAALIGCGGGGETTTDATGTMEGVTADPALSITEDAVVEDGMPTVEAPVEEAVTATEAPAIEAPAEVKDIVDTAAGNPDFSTLVAAVQAAELVDVLKGDGPFTVFAPTNEAFAKLPEGTVEDLLKPENKDKLTAILTYHVVPGKVMAADALKLGGQSATSVQGAGIPVEVDGGTVKVAGATVTATDIECSNGVIHVIDTVILPPEG